MVCVCMHKDMYVHLVSTAPHRGQKKASHPVELELHVVVSYHLVLGIEPRSSAGVAGFGNCLSILKYSFQANMKKPKSLWDLCKSHRVSALFIVIPFIKPSIL